jgi:hypothetical protein
VASTAKPARKRSDPRGILKKIILKLIVKKSNNKNAGIITKNIIGKIKA